MELCLYLLGFIYITQVAGEDISKLDMERGCADNNPADIVFILDESSSIWGPDFDRQIEFVEDVIAEFDVQEGATHIGVMTFSDDNKIHFQLGEITDIVDIENALEDIQQQTGQTHTYNAISEMYLEMFSDKYARSAVPRIGILITDGESADTGKTAYQAQLARDGGITMFAIGVGAKTNLAELHSIASKPADEYTFTVDSYGALDALKDILAWKACQVTTLPPPTTTTTTAPTTLPQMIEGCEGHIKADILFSLPDQAGIEGTEHAVTFIESVIGQTVLSPVQVQVGVTPRICEEAEAIKLNQHDTTDGLSADLATRRHDTCRTDQHIYYMRNQGIAEKNGARDDSIKVGVLIVDNASFNSVRTTREAERAKNAGMQLIIIGVGPRVNQQELQEVSSGPDSFFWVDDYSDLESKSDDVINRLCQGIMRQNGVENMRRNLYEYLLLDLIGSKYDN